MLHLNYQSIGEIPKQYFAEEKMKRKKLLFIFTALILTAVLAVALVGCVNDDDSGGNGGDTPPGPTTQDVTLSADQVKDYIGKIKIDLEANPKLTDNDGYSSSTACYSVKNGYASFSTSYTYNGAEVTEYIGPWASAYRTVTVIDYGSHQEATYRDLTDYEYTEIKEDAAEGFDYYTYYIEELKNMNATFQGIYPDLAYENYSGTEYADGRLNLKWELAVIISNNAMDMTATVWTDASKKVTELSITGKAMDGFACDAYDTATTMNLTVQVEYGTVVSLPDNGNSGNITEDVILQCAYGYFPEDFPTTYAPGSEVALPSAPEGTGLPGGAFIGWYYDSNYRYPVENDTFQIGYSDKYRTVYPKFSLSKPQLVLDGGELNNDDRVKAENAVKLFDYNNIRPTKKGYSFQGWYLDSEFTEQLDWSNGDKYVSGEMLYAKFVANTTLNLVTNADYNIVPVEGTIGESAYLPIVYKKGYMFAGWYTDEALTVAFDNVFPEQDTTLYAKFIEGITVNLVYYDGFVNTMYAPKYYVVAKNGNLNELIGTLNSVAAMVEQDGQGNVFTRWAIDKNGTAISAYPTSEVTYYAYYTAPAKLITKIPGGYEAEYYDTLQSAYLNNGANYTFEEWLNMQGFENTLLYNSGMDINQYKPDVWYIDEACTQKADLSVWPTVSTTLYMKILPRDKITFMYNGNEVDSFIFDTDYPYANSVYEYLSNNGLMPGGSWALEIDPSYYMLEGWYTDVELTQKYVPSKEYMDFPEGSVTVYAKVTENYNFIVNANVESVTTNGDLRMGNDAFPGLGGSGYTISLLKSDIYFEMASNDLTLAEYIAELEGECLATTVLYDNETSTNYVFTGFYTDAECTSRYTPGEEMDSVVTIYFGWEEQQAA